jgi:hypothetical protein
MKHSLPLLAVLAATALSAPLAAQDMSAFLNPSAMAARLGLYSHASVGALPRGYVYGAPQVDAAHMLALLEPEARPSLAPLRSLVPLPRGTSARILSLPHTADVIAVAPPLNHPAEMQDLLAEATRDAPAGANTAIIANGDGAVVIQSGPARPTLWQRIFGL